MVIPRTARISTGAVATSEVLTSPSGISRRQTLRTGVSKIRAMRVAFEAPPSIVASWPWRARARQRDRTEALATAQVLRIFFIVAAPRSGTTFIAKAMRHAPSTRSYVGNLMLPVTSSIYARAATAGRHLETRALEHGLASELARRGAFLSGREELARALLFEQVPADSLRTLLWRERPRNLVWKEPLLSFAPELALRAVPEARLFYILRDGRDVANSLVADYDVLTDDVLRTACGGPQNEHPFPDRPGRDGLTVPWWVPEAQVERFLAASQFGRAGSMWAAMVERCMAALEADPDRVVVARYEEFTRDPARLLETICSFLGEPESRPLRGACRRVSPRSIGRDKGRSAAELADFEALAGETLRKYGYS